MKSLPLLAVLLSFGLLAHAQNITGLFSGTLVNDSTKKVQQYELALTDYRGRITGYSYTTFVVNDTFYYSIKKVTGVKKDHVLVVEDEKMLANNFPQRADKGVHVINTIPLESVDTMRALNGTWRTTQTKKFYTIHGSLALAKDMDSAHSQLIGQLQDLNILPRQTTTETVKVKEKEKKEKIKTETKALYPQVAQKIPFDQRKARPLEELAVTSDSLVLSFYDNGIVDGDSITVYINGRNIISQQRLSEAAIKKTVYLKEFGDSDLQLTLVADNLGTIPPNTGLLLVQDGSNRYQVNFSADLQTNATLIMRRKQNGRH